ncbi:coagulation factor XIII B chain-like [Heteronotia binoei]|uniref:coagulation factor XIII B chain-like n=1 Tax=Heteronotia binoei TaxID=13085 RepID=UPI00292F680E|nr:coagulation factor XIII B chain-like [Heteronotia binoei]
MSGSDTVTCGMKVWSEPPTCIAVERNCGRPPVIQNGAVLNPVQAQYPPGTTLQYRCQNLYIMNGSPVMHCENGLWTKPPTCIAVERICGHPPVIQNGAVLNPVQAHYPPGTKLEYRCQNLYIMNGSPVVRCENGLWTIPPTCIAVERICGHPPVIQNGAVLNPVQAQYPPGTTLQYRCQNLYIMNGSPVVRCENGLWTKPPTCIDACIVRGEDMTRNNIKLRWKDAPYSTYGGLVEFMCRQNYRPHPSSPPFRSYCIDGRRKYPSCI